MEPAFGAINRYDATVQTEKITQSVQFSLPTI